MIPYNHPTVLRTENGNISLKIGLLFCIGKLLLTGEVLMAVLTTLFHYPFLPPGNLACQGRLWIFEIMNMALNT